MTYSPADSEWYASKEFRPKVEDIGRAVLCGKDKGVLSMFDGFVAIVFFQQHSVLGPFSFVAFKHCDCAWAGSRVGEKHEHE